MISKARDQNGTGQAASQEGQHISAFNSGASVSDIEATGKAGGSIAQWREKRGIDVSNQVRIVKLAHMRYQHPDLEEITTFLLDFGMEVAQRTEDRIWYKGTGSDAYVYYAQKGPKKFLGGAFLVETYEDLEKAAKLADVAIETLEDAPGGGHLVTLHDPEGMPINFIHGQQPASPALSADPLVLNFEKEKPRKRQFQRFQPGPAAVHKLGHYGLVVNNFEKQVEWYTINFNIVPTDFLYVTKDDGDKLIVAMFAHIDRGQEYTDHHSIFLSKGPSTHVHHCSFEVHDFDTQHLGHQWLAQKGYKSVWGVGRHILGSQIFDYWWDTTGNMIEHYADGDLINEETPIGHLPAGDETLAVWGPDVPVGFLD